MREAPSGATTERAATKQCYCHALRMLTLALAFFLHTSSLSFAVLGTFSQGCLCCLALLFFGLVSLQVVLDNATPTESAGGLRRSACQAALLLVSLQVDPLLELLATPEARQERAPTTQLFFPTTL